MGDFPGASPYDQMRAHQQRELVATQKLRDEVLTPRETVHEFTAESNGITVVIFNTKVMLIHKNGEMHEFPRPA